MGSNKDKLEKKRLKAQIKLEKKRAKHYSEQKDEHVQAVATAKKQTKTDNSGTNAEDVSSPPVPRSAPAPNAQVPWYRNPDWLRAIAGIASLVVAIIALIITFSR